MYDEVEENGSTATTTSSSSSSSSRMLASPVSPAAGDVVSSDSVFDDDRRATLCAADAAAGQIGDNEASAATHYGEQASSPPDSEKSSPRAAVDGRSCEDSGFTYMNAADVAEVLHAGRVRSTAVDPPARSDLLCSDDPMQPAADSGDAGRGRAEDETDAAGLSESSGARVSTSVQSVAGSAAASQTTSIGTSTTAADVDGVVRESKVTTHTHTHPFNGPLSGTTLQVSRYQKGKTNLDFTEARDSEWQWHQLGHMQVCTSLQTAPHHSVFCRPDALPAAQPTTASKH